MSNTDSVISSVTLFNDKILNDEIDQGYLDQVWSTGFNDLNDVADSVSEQIFNTNNESILVQILFSLQTVSLDEDEKSEFWLNVNDSGIKNSITIFGIIIRLAKKNCSYENKHLALIACEIYVQLLRIPGSSAYYFILHQALFEDVTFYIDDLLEVKESTSPAKKPSGRAPKSGGRGAKAVARRAVGDEIEVEISTADQKRLLADSMQLLRSFTQYLHAHALDIHCLAIAAQFYIKLLRFSDLFSEMLLEEDINDINNILVLSYKGLLVLCTELHGRPKQNFNIILKKCINYLLLKENNAKYAKSIQINIIQLFCYMNNKEFTHDVLVILMKHLLANCDERVDTRTNVADVYTTILGILPTEHYTRSLLYLQDFTCCSKIKKNRILGLQIYSKLISLPDRPIVNENIILNHNVFLNIIISKCIDYVPMVRARALTFLAHCLVPDDNITDNLYDTCYESFIKSFFKPSKKCRNNVKGLPAIRDIIPALVQRLTDAKSAVRRSAVVAIRSLVVVEHHRHLVAQEVAPPGDGGGNNGDVVCGEILQPMPSDIPGDANKSRGYSASDTIDPLAIDNIEGENVTEDAGENTAEKDGDKTSDGVATDRDVDSVMTPVTNREDNNADGINAAENAENTVVDANGKETTPNLPGQDLLAINLAQLCSTIVSRPPSNCGLPRLEKTISDVHAKFDFGTVRLLAARCYDTALSVRKQALVSLTSLLPVLGEEFESIWLENVMPMVEDRELKVQEKALQFIEENIFRRLSDHDKVACERAWRLVDNIASGEPPNRHYLHKTFFHWLQEKKIDVAFINKLMCFIDTEHNKSTWMIFNEIADPEISSFPIAKICSHWKQLKFANPDDTTCINIIDVMRKCVTLIGDEDLKQISDDFKFALSNFVIDTKFIRPVCLFLNEANKKEDDRKDLLEFYKHEILIPCENYIHDKIYKNIHEQLNENAFIRRIFSVGELSVVCSPMSKSLIEIMKMTVVVPLSYHVAYHDLLSQTLTQSNKRILVPKLRCQCFTSLGKLCLLDDDLARKCIKVFSRELACSKDENIRSNLFIVLTDLYVAFTYEVNNEIEILLACLKDTPFIRKQALLVISSLIKDDYIKWRGIIFYRITTAFHDDLESIRTMAEYLFVFMLKGPSKKMCYQHFIDGIFHYNSYKDHPAFNNFEESDESNSLFSLAGDDNIEKRFIIYNILLKNMTNQEKFDILLKLCETIFNAFIDNKILYNDKSKNILRDTLRILTSDEIKVTSFSASTSTDNEDEDEIEVSSERKKAFLNQQKLIIVDGILPLLIELKNTISQNSNAMLKDVMIYLMHLYDEFGDIITEALKIKDPQLESELRYDIRIFKEKNNNEDVNDYMMSINNGNVNVPVVGTPVSNRLNVFEEITNGKITTTQKIRKSIVDHSNCKAANISLPRIRLSKRQSRRVEIDENDSLDNIVNLPTFE